MGKNLQIVGLRGRAWLLHRFCRCGWFLVGKTVLLTFAGWVTPLSAQKSYELFERPLTFDEIQHLISEGIRERDLRKQAFGWYRWALYREEGGYNRDSAFSYLARSVEYFKQAGDSLAYHRARAELATRMPERGMADEALVMHREALQYFKKLGDQRSEVLLLAQMARVHQLRGDTLQAAALRFSFRDRSIALGDTLLLITALLQEVDFLREEKRYAEAHAFAFRARDLARQSNRTSSLVEAEYRIGHLNFSLGDYPLALRAFKRAEEVCSAASDEMRCNLYRHLYTVYYVLDSAEQALLYAQRYIGLTDTILRRDRLASSLRLAVQYGTHEHLKRVERLSREIEAVEEAKQQQRSFFYAISLFFAAAIIALFFMARDYRHRLRTSRVIAEQREQINQQMIRQLEDALRIESMQSMIEGQESERRRIAHDLHDSVGGMLAAIRMRLESLSKQLPQLANSEDFVKVKELLADTIAETRQISHNLQPISLSRFGLVKAIQDLIARFRTPDGPAIHFQKFGNFDHLDHTIALNCYRIIQELLQNSIKHAQATEILVQLTRTGDDIAILVEDNGIGFDPAQVTKGMGSDNIRQRVQFIRGEINVQAAIGQGVSTLVTVSVKNR
ncbi:MAG: sensor histidine kinase [Saprospiraceae bacterium]|nr:sensor histidine kinase [Saprospiraceae bacterium]MDW8483208.1 sensor histidine kinase [Saprospiraceae bacterium]